MGVWTILSIIDHPLELVGALAALLVSIGGAWVMVTRRGPARLAGGVVALVALIVAIVVLVQDAAVRDVLVVVAAAAIGVGAARYAVGVDPTMLREQTPPGVAVESPQRPVLLMNPRSGGGKVGKFDLVNEAKRRGIEPVVLQPGDDLATLARDAVARGVDALGMAGGDGSQALVAGIAAEHDLPFVCIPAGTRNHLALDLGVDRDDVVGSLDAFVDGYERRIDLARVNGSVFVNNVSLGVYARIVQSEEYRDAKVQTAANMLPDLLGPGTNAFDFDIDRRDGSTVHGPVLVLVSNNVYELTRLGGFGSRARLDAGVLGVITLEVRTAADVARLVALETAGRVNSAPGWKAWTSDVVEVRSGQTIEAGVDGEALVYESPLRFEIAPRALRVRVARNAPGLSPAHAAGLVRSAGPGRLLRVAFGRPTSTSSSSS
jgi:diacylglycerol kinase family enzyme